MEKPIKITNAEYEELADGVCNDLFEYINFSSVEKYNEMTNAEYEALADRLYDNLFKDDSTGEYELLIAVYYWQRLCKAMKAKGNVVFKRNEKDNWRMPVIVVERNGKYQDFYYNNDEKIWKMLSEGEFQTWWEEEEVCFNPKVPEFLEGKCADGPTEVLIDNGDPICIKNY